MGPAGQLGAAGGPDRSRRLVAFLAVIALGPLLILDVAALRLSAGAARRQAERQVGAAASAAAVAVQQELQGLTGLVESFAERPTVKRVMAGPAATGTEELRSHLEELRSGRPGIDLVFVADAQGTLLEILPATPAIVGGNFSFRDWYRGVVSTGQPYVSEVYETAATGGGAVVAAAAPIVGGSGPGSEISGILVAGYRLGTLQRFVEEFSEAQGVSLTVTDRNGVVVAAPGADTTRLVSRRDEPGVAAALAGRSGTGQAERTGGDVVTAHAPVQGLGWALVADLPASVALGELGELRAAILALAGAGALVLVVGLVVLHRALRRRSIAEEEVRRSQSFLDSVVENIPNMVFVKDAAELRFVRFNRAGEELLGYRREELVGRSDHDFFPPGEAEFFVDKDRQVLEGGHLVDIPVEVVQTRVHGERVLHTRKIPIPGPDGSPQYLLGISEDITERQLAEAALEEARMAADAANRAKNQFLSRMSHELRTPLNSVLGFGQLLQLDDLRPDQRDSVDQILRGGAHLLELIDEVLDISRVESGHLRLSLEPVRVGDVVAEATAMMGPLAATRRVHIDAADCQDLHVRADRQRLRQVVVNLLSNAVKYNRDDGQVRVRCEETGTGSIRLVVADTGIGLDPSDVARLFQPFERLGAEQSGVEGTGLGLALSKQLAEAMGGRIEVHSEPGVGSRFSVELPVAEPPSEMAEPPEAAEPPAAPTSPVLRTVLYVEDNLSNVKLVERVAARLPGVELLVAMQGSLAVELAREHRPGLVLLDLHLPDMPGEEVLRRLRSDRRTSATPVVVLSADATPGQIERLKANGASDYLTKPFEIPRLMAVIDGHAVPEVGDAGCTPAQDGGFPGEGGAGSPLDPFTVAGLHELADSSPTATAGVREAVSTFLDEAEARLADLRGAVAGGDARRTEQVAHSLSGSSASFGASRLAARCREIEQQARGGEVEEMVPAVDEVAELFTAAAAALQEEFPGEGDGTGGDGTPR